MSHSISHKICLTQLDIRYVSLDKTGEDKDYAGNEPSLHSGERLSLGRTLLCLVFVNNGAAALIIISFCPIQVSIVVINENIHSIYVCICMYV